ncbi:MAG: hypothetical protein ACI9N1_000419 [Flavobacteriales bacterium]|jgi:hypothetical protein
MKLFFTLSIGLVIAFASCTAIKPAAEEAKAETAKMDREKTILSEGYSKAKVVNKGGECGFMLEVIDGGSLLNPISWPEPEVYQKEGNIVWVKYRESRSPQNGCLEGKPAVIDEIKLIE